MEGRCGIPVDAYKTRLMSGVQMMKILQQPRLDNRIRQYCSVSWYNAPRITPSESFIEGSDLLYECIKTGSGLVSCNSPFCRRCNS